METGKGVLKRRIKRLEELLESVKSSKGIMEDILFLFLKFFIRYSKE